MIYAGLVTYNSAADLPACFAGLRAQTSPDIAVMAFDNASSDGSAVWLRANAPEAHLIVSAENLGYGRAHNRLIAAANLRAGDVYLALNPDAVLSSGYIAALCAALNAAPDIGWATGKLMMQAADGTPMGCIYSVGHGLLPSGFAFNIGYGLADDARFAQSREVFGASGAAVIYKAEMIADLTQDGDFFDRDMFMYAEDTDVDWRARRRGWRCWYIADAVASHRGSAPGGKMKMTAVANRYLSVLKNADMPELIARHLPVMAAHCLARLLVTPRLGWRLASTLITRAPAALRRRRRAGMPRRVMQDWFRWSAQQPTTQRPYFARRGSGEVCAAQTRAAAG